ncbi:hypothetical protein T492DRAFT_1127217 [Pavlovales sp. CCMP2436]|nr:hypothetical protein T492DRAFT_1127217 [Pavlovales sp. CCMP2436]
MILFASTLARNCLLGIACIVCLQAVTPAALQETLLRLLAVPGALIMMLHVPLAHHRKAALAISVAALLAAVMLALGFGASTRYAQSNTTCEAIAVLLGLVVLRRLRVLYLTAQATAPTAAFFRVASLFLPAYSYSEKHFFEADRAPEKVVLRRRRAFSELSASWKVKWPKSGEVLGEAFDPATVAARTEGPHVVDVDGQRIVSNSIKRVVDVDGQRLLDAAGSYGVNVCGYERRQRLQLRTALFKMYKRFMAEGIRKSSELGCVLGPISTVTLENIKVRACFYKK